MVDRYADAVRARRVELRAERQALAGGHRAELRSALVLARLTVAGASSSGLRALAREAEQWIGSADRAGRAALPGAVAAAVDQVVTVCGAALAAELGPALRRAAGARGLVMPPGWPVLRALDPPPRPDVWVPRGRFRGQMLSGAVAGLALWRVLLIPLGALPLVGLPALGGPALAPLAAGLAIAGIVLAVRSRVVAADRAALRRGVDDTLAAARLVIEAGTARRLVEIERSAGDELDRVVDARRTVVDAELGRLAPVVADA